MNQFMRILLLSVACLTGVSQVQAGFFQGVAETAKIMFSPVNWQTFDAKATRVAVGLTGTVLFTFGTACSVSSFGDALDHLKFHLGNGNSLRQIFSCSYAVKSDLKEGTLFAGLGILGGYLFYASFRNKQPNEGNNNQNANEVDLRSS